MVQHTFSQINVCGTDQERKKLLEKYPEILDREAVFDKLAAERLSSIMRMDGDKLIIPLVFHIVHDYGAENISDAQVYDAVEKINQDFSKTNPDFLNTIAEFIDVAAVCDIEFRLAQRELSGGCTNGIDRIASLRTYEGSDAAKLGGWQSGKYLNIWVVKDLESGAAAYAYYPTSIAGLLYTVDGIICRYDYVGTIGSSGTYAAHVLSHEIGHYLNLQHVWGNSNSPGVACGDDQVGDTPITEGWTSCTLAGNSCEGIVDNVQNHMEYSYCTTMFTEGQKARMMATLEAEDALRNNLWTEGNLELTGTSDGYIGGLCLPVADFYSTYRMVCQGSTANFHDVSYNGVADSRLWEFEGGTPSTSTDLDPIITYSIPGWHNVTLTVNNATGADTKEFENYLYVSASDVVYDAAYQSNFNDEATINNDWLLYNKYPDDREWKWRSTNGYFNTGCIWLNSRFGPNLETDAAISPAFNLSLNETDNVFFKYSTTSYGVTTADYTMSLKLYYSNNCGQTWIYMNKVTGQDLISSYGGSSDFYPNYPDQWSSVSFDLPEAAKTSNVRFKIEFLYNYYCNNVFIDDFNFTSGYLSTPVQEELIPIKISPNPVKADNETLIYYSLKEQSNVELSITDIFGRTISIVDLGLQQPGSNQYVFRPSDHAIKNGCYQINLNNGQFYTGGKLVVF